MSSSNVGGQMHLKHGLRRTVDQCVSQIARVRSLNGWGSALLGMGCAVAMLGVRLVLDEAYGGATGFMILLPAVMIAALAGGLTAGLSAAVACLVGGWLLIVNPLGSGPLPQWSVARASTINFVVISLFASVLSASLRNTLHRLDASLHALEKTSIEARKSEAARRDTEVQLRAMVEQAAAGIARVNLAGRLVSANARLCEILGRSQDQIIGLRIVDVTHPEDVQLTLDVMQSAIGQIEKRYVRPDGILVWCLTSVAPLNAADGSLEGYIAVIVDISDTKSAEGALLESEARFRAIADTAPVLIWVSDADRKRLFVNQAYVAFCGLSDEEALAADWSSLLHPEDYEHTVRQAREGEASGEAFSLEARYLQANGDYRWLKSLSRPRRSDQSGLIGYVGVAFDITDARRAEEDLKRINELLEERVSEALAEKARAEADLMHAQKMEAVGRLTGGVAHDFNNLLTVVIGALDMMLKSPDDAARRKKLGEAALAAARRGEGLTHQLLAFSRRQALRPEAVDLNDLIQEGMPLLKRAVGDSIILDVRFRPGGARVKVDVAQFEAALLNLLVNARDAIGDRKRGKVTIRTRTCAVRPGRVPDLTAGRYICVSVQDNGSGMDAETLTRVFEPFFTTKAIGKGTGLGLSQVYGFTRQSGGGAEIVATSGKGTDIRLYLPLLESPKAQAISLSPAKAVSQRLANRLEGCTLLLVEDDPQVSDMAHDLLQGLGLQISTASNASQALSALARQRFDIMLSDVVMPGEMSGIDLARTCSIRWPEMKILLTSGYAGEDVDQALSDAPWRLLPKPYSSEQLAEALTRELTVLS